jgi:hypothetical protein
MEQINSSLSFQNQIDPNIEKDLFDPQRNMTFQKIKFFPLKITKFDKVKLMWSIMFGGIFLISSIGGLFKYITEDIISKKNFDSHTMIIFGISLLIAIPFIIVCVFLTKYALRNLSLFKSTENGVSNELGITIYKDYLTCKIDSFAQMALEKTNIVNAESTIPSFFSDSYIKIYKKDKIKEKVVDLKVIASKFRDDPKIIVAAINEWVLQKK